MLFTIVQEKLHEKNHLIEYFCNLKKSFKNFKLSIISSIIESIQNFEQAYLYLEP